MSKTYVVCWMDDDCTILSEMLITVESGILKDAISIAKNCERDFAIAAAQVSIMLHDGRPIHG